jgi:EAL domain-containing protein (putative c-di-GMP-specific phosphodiesterase class I)
MSVNISAAQFEFPGFVDSVRKVLEHHQLEAETLTLEVNESLLMQNRHAIAQVLSQLKRAGVRIAIDDTGTGYSSLAYLQQFPVDSLKIDRSFIAKASQNPQDGALIHALVQMGKALGIETLAEGIEEHSQLTALQQERCDSGQGFLYARPLPPEDLVPYFFVPRPTESGVGGTSQD